MNAPTDIPPWLEPDPESDHFLSPRILAIGETADSFAREFNIDYELALVTLLAGAAHSLGGAVRIESTLGSIAAPFSLLLVTPERDPVWPGIPFRFLTDEFVPTLRLLGKVSGARGKRDPDGQAEKNGDQTADGNSGVEDLAKNQYLERLAGWIATGSLVPPYPRAPFDHHVLLINPPGGLVRGLRQLPMEDRVRLENALASDRPQTPNGSAPAAGVPSFHWTIPRNVAARLMGENPWLVGLPFLMLESATLGHPALDPEQGCAGALVRQHLDLFILRHNTNRASRRFSAGAACFNPVHQFLKEAQGCEAQADNAEMGTMVSACAVARLALRLALLFTVLDGKTEPDHLAVDCGLTLARQLTMRHCRTLAAHAPKQALPVSQAPDLIGLGMRERAVFLRICERQGITASELSRSFGRLRRDERDLILAELIVRHLIRLENGRIWQGGVAV